MCVDHTRRQGRLWQEAQHLEGSKMKHTLTLMNLLR